jgi:hypothetical protein
VTFQCRPVRASTSHRESEGKAGFDHHLAKPDQLKSLELVLLESCCDRGRTA